MHLTKQKSMSIVHYYLYYWQLYLNAWFEKKTFRPKHVALKTCIILFVLIWRFVVLILTTFNRKFISKFSILWQRIKKLYPLRNSIYKKKCITLIDLSWSLEKDSLYPCLACIRKDVFICLRLANKRILVCFMTFHYKLS